MEGVPDCDVNSPLAFYFYFIFMNIIWIVVPLLQIWQSIGVLLSLVVDQKSVTQRGRSTRTTTLREAESPVRSSPRRKKTT